MRWCPFSFRRCCLLGGRSAGNEVERLAGHRGTNSSHQGLFLKFMFISVLKGVESFFKTSSAAAIDVPKARSRHGAAVCGLAAVPACSCPEAKARRAGTAREWKQAREEPQERGALPRPCSHGTKSGTAPPSPPVLAQLAGCTATASSLLSPGHKPLLPTVVKSSVSVLECSTEGETS